MRRREKYSGRKRRFKEFQEVGLTNESRNVLLLRIPPSVRRIWDSVSESDTLLGRIRIYKAQDTNSNTQSQNNSQKVTLHLDKKVLEDYKKQTNTPTVPVSDYALKFGMKKDLKMRVFSEKVQSGSASSSTSATPGDAMMIDGNAVDTDVGNKVQLEGIVEDICTLQPELSKSYINFASKRSISVNKGKQPTMKTLTFEEERSLSTDRDKRSMQKLSTLSTSPTTPSTPLMPGDLDNVTRTLSVTELREVLFKLFSSTPLWTFKDLKNKTMQPEKLLKEVLKEICDYHKSGSHAAKYELKKHYRHK